MIIADNQYSFLVLTYNENFHLFRLLNSIKELFAPIYIVDSFSTDDTVQIARNFGCIVKQNKFINHPLQWDFALKNCEIETEWVICLDADQIVTESLFQKLKNFKDSTVEGDINAIYFNRHNYFQGSRLKFGGYRNFYMLKMFRRQMGGSDLSENMDHRFICSGKSIIWKDAILIEDNIKEQNIDFWIAKHLKYSSAVAEEEYKRSQGLWLQSQPNNDYSSVNAQRKYLKKLWWKLPLFVRPHFYFIYRFIFRLGFLDNRSGRVFHFLQAYWFRMLVDYKIFRLKLTNGAELQK